MLWVANCRKPFCHLRSIGLGDIKVFLSSSHDITACFRIQNNTFARDVHYKSTQLSNDGVSVHALLRHR